MLKTKPCLVFWLVLATVSTGAVAEQGLRTIPLDDLGLSWIRSAIWVEERSMVVLTDYVGQRVVEVELSGAGLPRKGPSATELRPAYVAESGNGFLQMVLDQVGMPQEFHWFGRDLARRGATSLLKPKQRGGSSPPRGEFEDAIVAFYSWIVAGDRIFSYGVLDDGSGTTSAWPYKFGFFTYKLRSPGSRAGFPRADLVETFQEAEYYTLGSPYFVALGSEVYYMEMGVHPALKFYDVEQGGTPVYLDGLPGGSEPLPQIDADRPTAEVFDRIESLSMPAGLYADRGFLYLLHRQPENGGTRWTMTKLRPAPKSWAVDDLGTVRLPTQAPHLTVLFTPTSALLFERSSVHPGTREQEVEAMQILPKFWVTDPGGSPLGE